MAVADALQFGRQQTRVAHREMRATTRIMMRRARHIPRPRARLSWMPVFGARSTIGNVALSGDGRAPEGARGHGAWGVALHDQPRHVRGRLDRLRRLAAEPGPRDARGQHAAPWRRPLDHDQHVVSLEPRRDRLVNAQLPDLRDPRAEGSAPVVLLYPYGIVVDRRGLRFFDEGSGLVHETWEWFSRHIHFATEGRRVYAILDARVRVGRPEPKKPLGARTT